MAGLTMRTVIGIDIGGTKIAAQVCDERLQPLAEQVIATPAAAQPAALAASLDLESVYQAGRAALLGAIIELCRTLPLQFSHTVAAIGIGTAGQVDPARGIVLDANENLVGWRGTPIVATLEAALQLPVAVDNDVRTMALAESTLGAGKAYDHLLCLTVGTGIGGALVFQRRLWHGAHFSAGEIGYLYADDQHTLEQRCAGPALEKQYHAQTDIALPLPQIAQRALQGEAVATAILREGAVRCGRILAPVIALLDPQAVIVGGGMVAMATQWWQPFCTTIQNFHLRSVRQTPLQPAALGNRAGMMGAALLAWHKIGHSV
jgi:glucokinase